MIAQLETNRATVLKGLGSYRGQANKTVSALIQVAESSPNAAQIWTQIESDFIRLSESPTHDIRILSPQQAVEAARQSEWRQIRSVATSFERDGHDINRYREILGATLTLALQEKGLIFTVPPTINQVKYEQLQDMHKEANAIAATLDQPTVRKSLDLMPDLEALLYSFQKYSTVRIFLEENGTPYGPRYISSFNSDLRDYLFGHKTPKMGVILRKATFSRWINRRTNWYGTEESEIEKSISKSAEFVYSVQPPREIDNKVRHIRWFLNETMAQELKLALRDINFGHKYSLDEIFVPTNGTPIGTAADIDIPKTFKLFASFATCPESLRSVVQQYLVFSNPPPTYERLAATLYRDLAYASVSKQRWIEGGFTFLENVLLLKPRESPSWNRISIERRAMLRKFREIFQQTLGT